MGRFGWIPKLFKNALNKHGGDYLQTASASSPQTHYRSTPHLSRGCNNAATTNANRFKPERRNGQTVDQVPGTTEHSSSTAGNTTRGESHTASPHLRNECNNLTNPTAKSSKRTNIQDTIHVPTADDHTTSRNKTRLSRRKHYASSPQLPDECCVSPATSGSDTDSKQTNVQQLGRARVYRSSMPRKRQHTSQGGHYSSMPHLPNKGSGLTSQSSRDSKGTDSQDTRHTARVRERRPATSRSTSCPSRAGHQVTSNDTGYYRNTNSSPSQLTQQPQRGATGGACRAEESMLWRCPCQTPAVTGHWHVHRSSKGHSWTKTEGVLYMEVFYRGRAQIVCWRKELKLLMSTLHTHLALQTPRPHSRSNPDSQEKTEEPRVSCRATVTPHCRKAQQTYPQGEDMVQ